MPPEIILLPNWFYFNIYEFASWSRATIVALMVVLTRKPVCPVPESAYIHELYLEPPDRRNYTQPRRGRFFSWESFFLLLDSLFKAWERLPFKPGRGMALRKAEKWIAEHQEADGSWGGIMLPWVYSLFALKDLGYALDHPVMERGIRGLEDFIVEDDSTLRMQPAVSPIWDTAWSVLALRDSGLPPDHPALVKAARWLLGQQVLTGGDWQVKNPDTKPGAWAFEFENDLYPDIDDTAVVPRALMRVDLPEAKDKAEAIEKALRWTLSLQSANGGWAAFDRDNHKRILAHIPFADFMTPLDPPSPDVTAHAVELLSCTGSEGTPLQKAIAYLKKVQEGDGAWYGRWGVNYIYGTGLVLASLRAAGEDMEQESIQKAVVWLEAHQNNDGGWGETCGSYDDPDHRGEGPSTASQTAWALMGLLAANKVSSPTVQGGLEYLLRSQRQDGAWEEEAFTGTGFPRAFYLRYHLYPGYFPLIALSQFRTLTRGLI